MRFINEIENGAKDTQIALKNMNITEKEALTLEFVFRATLARLSKNNKEANLFSIGGMHMSGKINGEEMRKLVSTIILN